MSTRNGLPQKLLAFILVLSMVFSFANIGDIFASGYQYHININPSGVVAPKASTNPFNVEEGTQINVGVKVADESGFEVEDIDEEFGDATPRYSAVVWDVEGDNPGITLSTKSGLISKLTAVTPGKYYINLTYPTNNSIEPLRLEVNVTPSANAATRINRIEPQNPPTRIRVGETAQVNVVGYNVANGEVEPNLSVKRVVGGSFLGATTSGHSLTLTGKSEGNATVTIKDVDGAEASLNVEVYDDRLWDFDADTFTIKGFVKKGNTPETVEIPVDINGIPVKHIGKDAFKYSSTSASLRKVSRPIKSLTLPEGLLTTGYMSFQSNDISSIVIPQSLTTLGGRTFYGNVNLATVNFAENSQLTTIEGGAFYNTGLESIVLPTSVTVINEDVFKETKLRSIQLHEGITEIGAQAFSLDAIEEITIPSTVTTLNLDKSNPNRPREGQGLFFSNFVSNDKADKSRVKRFTKVFDKSGIATTLNTRGVVNPVSVIVNYKNTAGETIKPSEIIVGQETNTIEQTVGNYNIKKNVLKKGDGHFYTDYLNPHNNIIDVYTKADFVEKIIGENYFTENKEYSFKAPAIAGYKTPANVVKTITKSDNSIDFIYEDAQKFKLTLNGEGLTANDNKIVEGKSITFKVHMPTNKDIEKLTIVTTKNVDGSPQSETVELTKDQLTFDGVDYTYEYDKYGDTEATVSYVDSQVENNLSLDLGKESIKLGGIVNFDPMYRGVSVAHDKLNITFTENTKNKIKENEKSLMPMDAGSLNVTVSLKDYPDISVTKTVNVEAVDVTVRMEDDKNTVLEPTKVSIDKLYFEEGQTYFVNKEFEHITPILAIEKALRVKGVNTGVKEEFNCMDSGNFMLLLGKELWKNINPKGSYMYYVNNKYADKGVGEYQINENDTIYVYYDPDWNIANAVGYFTEESYEIFEGESVEFTFMGSTYDFRTDKTTVAPISNAALEIKKDDNVVVTDEKTSAEGNLSYTFSEPGTYYISAVSVNTPAEFTRPKAKVVVDKAVIMGSVLENSELGVKIKLPKAINLRDYALVVEAVDKDYSNKLVENKYEAKEIHIINKETKDVVEVASLTDNREITVEIAPASSLLNEELKVFVEEEGKLKEHPSTHDGTKVTFSTPHLSTWIVGVEKKDMKLKAPETPVKVDNKDALTEEEINLVKGAIIAANQDLGLEKEDIQVENNGDVIVTKEGYNDGQLRNEVTVSQKTRLELNNPKNKIKVDNLTALTDDEKTAVKDAIIEANPNYDLKIHEIVVKSDGSAMVIKDGYLDTPMDKANLVEEKTILEITAPAGKIKVVDSTALTDEEKELVKEAIVEANKDKNLTKDNVEVDDEGNVTVTTEEFKPGILTGKAVVENKVENPGDTDDKSMDSKNSKETFDSFPNDAKTKKIKGKAVKTSDTTDLATALLVMMMSSFGAMIFRRKNVN